MDTTNPPRCHTCLFWTGNRKQPEGSGECHAIPPQIAGLINQSNIVTGKAQPVAISCFPSITGMTWCGLWQGERQVLQ